MTVPAKAKARRQTTRRQANTPAARRGPRILVATAGDADSVGALWLASKLAEHRSATVMALGVVVPFEQSLPSMLSIRSPVVVDNESRQRTRDEVRARLRDVPGGDRWSKEVIVGWPADVINSVAGSWGASLIAIGLGRHGRVNRLFGTETAVAVIKAANVPVLAVSADARSLPLHACAAVDFTRASLAAATLTASLLSTGGTLSLVHACAFKGADAQEGDLIDLYRAGARTNLDKAVAEVRRHTRRRVEGVMIDGEPAETILGFARRERCDLIALGGHEQGLVDRILLGSVRTRVLRGAKCSVLVAPPTAGEPR